MLSARELFEQLLRHYGSQGWWPAKSCFEVMVGALLVQRTTWGNAARAIETLRAANLLQWRSMLAMRPEALASHIKVAGFYNTKAERLIGMAGFVESEGGTPGLARLSTEALRKRLLTVRGVGAETADAILLYGFERAVFVDDAYARRIVGRINAGSGLIEPMADYAAALLEAGDLYALNELHALIVEHGKRQCLSKPRCESCVLRPDCDYISF